MVGVSFLVALSASLLAGSAIADPIKPDVPPLNVQSPQMTSFDPSTNTYGGYVHVDGKPCAEAATYSLNLSFSGARDTSDAMEKVKPLVKKISDDYRRDGASCKR